MKRFWSDELQDENNRLTHLCVEQRERIRSLEVTLAHTKCLFDVREEVIRRMDARIEELREMNRKLDSALDTAVELIQLLEERRSRDPKIAKVIDDFIQREACGAVDLSSDQA